MININKIITSDDQTKIDKLEKKAIKILKLQKVGRKTLEIDELRFCELAKTHTNNELSLIFKCSQGKINILKNKYQIKKNSTIDLQKAHKLLIENKLSVAKTAKLMDVNKSTLYYNLCKINDLQFSKKETN
jgi:hypothetical protein